MKMFKLAVGFAAGYVLGTRAGREKFDQIAAAARKASSHPTVVQAQEKAKTLIAEKLPRSETPVTTPPTTAVTAGTDSVTTARTPSRPRPAPSAVGSDALI